MSQSNGTKNQNMLTCLITSACIGFLIIVYLINNQNIYVVVNSMNSERRDGYSIALSDRFGNMQDQAAGPFYEHCVIENLGRYSSKKQYIDVFLSPLEKTELQSISIYFENILIEEYKGAQILSAFSIENGKVVFESDSALVFEKIDESQDIIFSRHIDNEIQAMQALFFKTIFRSIGFGILIYFALRAGIERYEKKQKKGKPVSSNVFVFFLLSITVVIVWGPYLVGEKYFIFTMQDIANDSINQTYPILLRQAHELTEGTLSNWSFSYGLGGKNSFSIFNFIYCAFGPSLVKYMLGFGAAAYCLLAGMIFFQYAKLLDMPNYIKYIGAMSYAFCGCMMVRSAWQGYFKEILLVAYLLYALEKWTKENDWKHIPLAYGLLFALCGIYSSAIWAAVGMGYCLMRYALQEGFRIKHLCNKLFLLMLFLASAMAIASYALMPSVMEIFNSTRVQTMVSGIGAENNMAQFFTPYTFKEIAKSFSRIFSNTYLGINNYNGIDHWMSDVALYSGLFAILLIPQSFLEKKRAPWNGLLYGICAYYICFPTLRSLVNVFSDRYNSRLSSFWINVVLIYVGCYTLKNVIENKRCNKTLLVVTACVECLAILMGTFFMKTSESWLECAKAVFFISVITFIILCYLKQILDKNAVKKMLVMACACEIIAISYPAIQNRAVLTSHHYDSNSYEDGTVKLVETAISKSGDSFFRINKSYQSVGMNDALYQGYYGTASYLGGTTHSNHLLSFNDAIGVRNMYSSTSYLLGYDGISSVNTLLGVRYNLSKDDFMDYGYQMVSQNEGIYLSENKNYLPLGFTYDAVMAKSDFDMLNVYDRREALLHCAIVNDDSDLLKSNSLSKITDYGFYDKVKTMQEKLLVVNREQSTISKIEENYFGISANKKIVFEAANADKEYIIVLADLELSSRSTAYITYNYVNDDGTEKKITRNLYLQEGENNVRLDIPARRLKSISLRFEKSIGITVHDLLTCSVNNDFYSFYDVDCESRKQNVLSLSEFKNDYIKGNIQVSSPQLLFLSIPYDDNWKLYIDGKKADIENCNLAFCGYFLESGAHLVELRYEHSNPYVIVSVIVLGGYVIFLIGIKKLRGKTKICQKKNQKQFKALQSL